MSLCQAIVPTLPKINTCVELMYGFRYLVEESKIADRIQPALKVPWLTQDCLETTWVPKSHSES